MSNVDRTGWLIERHYNGTLRYWNGRPLDSASVANFDARNLDAGAWTEKATDAIWFLDEESAAGVLAWCCGGVGRAAQHMVIQKAQVSGG